MWRSLFDLEWYDSELVSIKEPSTWSGDGSKVDSFPILYGHALALNHHPLKSLKQKHARTRSEKNLLSNLRLIKSMIPWSTLTQNRITPDQTKIVTFRLANIIITTTKKAPITMPTENKVVIIASPGQQAEVTLKQERPITITIYHFSTHFQVLVIINLLLLFLIRTKL